MLLLNHKNLEVYKSSHLLLKQVYIVTRLFPRDELFTLVRQLRRAAISVCSNIAEGSARKTKKERKRFYEMARSSAVEIDTQIEISLSLEFHNKDQIKDLDKYLESVFKMLSVMIKNLDGT